MKASYSLEYIHMIEAMHGIVREAVVMSFVALSKYFTVFKVNT